MTELRIGGVPEHFNLPWHRLINAQGLARLGLEARWRDFPDGSGAMAGALRTGALDVAMLLTEGAIAGAAAGGFKIVSLYTESPLIWGIHVPAASPIRTVDEVRGRRYAISRLGSGSHLMSFVHARERGWPAADIEFVVVGSLQGAIDAFANGTADVFFWEKFMTKPLIDAGKFRRVGEFIAPWPAFVVCVSTAALALERAIATLLEAVFASAAELAASPDAATTIAARHGLKPVDVREWLGTTRWAKSPGIGVEHVARAVAELAALGLIAADVSPAALIAPLVEH
jgi:ABC-type nitrate/sulfonate/bicarbonate transport system substrate-binding protein